MATATARMADDQIRWLVGQAARAPSVHNSQPWRFVWKDGHLDLYADTTRGLTAGDPDGREMVVSCGAALFNLRVAARKLDAVARVTLLPDARDPRWLARVQIEAALPADADERRAYAGLLRRHTHRGAFDTWPAPPALSGRLQAKTESK